MEFTACLGELMLVEALTSFTYLTKPTQPSIPLGR